MKATKIPARTKVEALRYIAQHLHKPGGLFVLQMLHDDGCRAMATQRDADCSAPCKPDFYLVEPFSEARAA